MIRPLVWITLGYLSSFMFITTFWETPILIAISILFIISVVGAFYRRKPMAFILCGALLGTAVIYLDFSKYIELEKYVGQEASIILSVDEIFSFGEEFGIAQGYAIITLPNKQIKENVKVQTTFSYSLNRGETVLSRAKIEEITPYWEAAKDNRLTLTLLESPTKTQSIRPLTEFFIRLNDRFVNKVDTILPADSASIINAMSFGNSRSISNQNKQFLKNASLSHIVVVSGQHLVIFASAMSIVWLRKKNFIGILLSIGFCWIFACFTGLAPSIFRGAIMFTITHFGFLINRRADSISSLCLSIIIMSMFEPTIVVSLSVILSVSAVLGIAVFSSGFKNNIVLCIMTIVGAQIGTLPTLILLNGSVSTYGIITNLIVIPFVLPMILIGFLLVFSSSFLPFLVAPIATLCNGLSKVIIQTAMTFSQLPNSTLAFTERFQLIWVVIVITLAFLYMIHPIKIKYRNFALCFLSLSITIPSLTALAMKQNTFEMYTFKNFNTVIYHKNSHSIVIGLPTDKKHITQLKSTLSYIGTNEISCLVETTSNDKSIYKIVTSFEVKRLICESSPIILSMTNPLSIELIEISTSPKIQFDDCYIDTKDIQNKVNLIDPNIIEENDIVKILSTQKDVDKYRIRMTKE